MKAMLAQNARGGQPSEGKGKGKGKEDGSLAALADPMAGGNPQGDQIENWDEVGRQEVVQVQKKGRQSRNAGIHTIEIYQPQFYFTQEDQEEFDARPDRYGPTVIGKYTKGIGQIEGRFPTDDEDPISFAMTVVHRLLERMEAKGINETGPYQFNGMPLNIWNAIGRLDIGTESITDRSKSMKSFVMDIFERYANETNIEGVDQYNACYGGQAAGLAVLSWVESDRWDGRYGIAVATDISEAHPMIMAFAGAATTAALFFPDAPLAHHSQRASCIMHRFDFCKPVGWHDMAPITDGKYSVECYLDALDAAHATLRMKLNGRGPLEITDFNVFHTGGGYHIVRKAFERLLRCENPKMKPKDKDALVQSKLNPSCHILKLVGPCHTVSSFLNISSVVMNTMEKGLGKIILVFTYGSGAASSMYQLRIDDVAFYDPYEMWKINFYRKAIKIPAENAGALHNHYIETWMKFDYYPVGRRQNKISIWEYEEDVYYLMEIDKFGRRFYHRGGMSAGPMDPSLKLPVDKAEERPERAKWGAILQRPEEEKKKPEVKDTKEERFREIEYAMAFGDEGEDGRYEELAEYNDRYNPDQKIAIRKPKQREEISVVPDGAEHSYQIVGTFSNREPQEMVESGSSWTCEVVLGENRWESFYILQDNDPERRIYPSEANASTKAVPVGPHSLGPKNEWLLDCRSRVTVPEEQVGIPGDKYLVTFRWQKLKELTWEKLDGEKGDALPGQYYLAGSWADFDFVDLQVDNTGIRRRKQGWYSTEVLMTSLGIEFKVARNKDLSQSIYPEAPAISTGLSITQHSTVCGPDGGKSGLWKIEDVPGSVYKISFYRDPLDCEPTSMRVDWKKVGDQPVTEPEPAYYMFGQYNGWDEWTATKMTVEEEGDHSIYTGEVPIQEIALDKNKPADKQPAMTFQILGHRSRSKCIHPDQDRCHQTAVHGVFEDENASNLSWCIGKEDDEAEKGDVFLVRLKVSKSGGLFVTWDKK